MQIMSEYKELRLSTGMGQGEFAKYFGVPLRTAQHWEYGDRKCPDYLIDLMKYKLEKEGLRES